MYQIPAKQKQLLAALAMEGKVENLTSGKFSRKYHITPASAQSAVQGLLDKGLVTSERGAYRLYDHFLQAWLGRKAEIV